MEKKRMLIAAVQELNEEEDAKFITQILVLIRMHVQRRNQEENAKRE